MRRIPWTVALCLSLGATPGFPQAPVDPAVAKLDELNRTLQQISGSMREILEGQKIDHLMKRIELQRRTLAPLEAELRQMRSEREGIAENRKQLEAQRALLEEQTEHGGQEQGVYEFETRQIDLQLEIWKEKDERLQGRIFDRENDLASRQAALRDWEEILDEALGLP